MPMEHSYFQTFFSLDAYLKRIELCRTQCLSFGQVVNTKKFLKGETRLSISSTVRCKKMEQLRGL